MKILVKVILHLFFMGKLFLFNNDFYGFNTSNLNIYEIIRVASFSR